jgi:hypothetical protein
MLVQKAFPFCSCSGFFSLPFRLSFRLHGQLDPLSVWAWLLEPWNDVQILLLSDSLGRALRQSWRSLDLTSRRRFFGHVIVSFAGQAQVAMTLRMVQWSARELTILQFQSGHPLPMLSVSLFVVSRLPDMHGSASIQVCRSP